MKKLFTSLAAVTLSAGAFATIHYTDYGVNGLHIAIDQALTLDLNNDGTIDFTFCDIGGGVSVTPTFIEGCIGADYANQVFDDQGQHFGYVPNAYTGTIGNGEPWQEGDPLPIWQSGVGGLGAWADNDSHYLGIMLMQTNTFGWMRVGFDAANEEFVLYEMAWDDSGSPIEAGYRGVVANINVVEAASANTYPNPAQDVVNVALNNMPDQVNLEVIDAAGRVIYRETLNNGLEATHQLNTSEWEAGQYFLRLQAGELLLRESVMVTR